MRSLLRLPALAFATRYERGEPYGGRGPEPDRLAGWVSAGDQATEWLRRAAGAELAPQPGLTHEARNCVSNIRPEGLAYPAAAAKLFLLLQESRRRQLSGVGLEDEFDQLGE
ncbi:MAG TPA: ethanolamine ammonia-lyase light chain EutC [Hymenobacter sp.]